MCELNTPVLVKYELKSAGWNVNTPEPLLYDNVPAPLADPVVTDKSVNAIPPASAAFTQALPLYFKTCPLVAPEIVVSDKALIDPPPLASTFHLNEVDE